MAITLIKSANLGFAMAGKASDVYYTIYNAAGAISAARTNSGVYEIGSNTGVYGASVSIANDFQGSIFWDVNGTSIYAVEEISADTRLTRLVTSGRWQIDAGSKQMIFYEEDNVTEVMRFNLKDRTGSASFSEVFDRVKV